MGAIISLLANISVANLLRVKNHKVPVAMCWWFDANSARQTGTMEVYFQTFFFANDYCLVQTYLALNKILLHVTRYTV